MTAFTAAYDFLANNDREIGRACVIGLSLAVENWLVGHLGRRAAYDFLQRRADRVATEIITGKKER
jgi:hypothetical protein